MVTPLSMFGGPSLNLSKEKYDVWLVDEWIPSYCAIVIFLHVFLGMWEFDLMIILYFILCMCLTIYYFYCHVCLCISYICMCLYLSALHNCMLHDYPPYTWCMTCLFLWDAYVFSYSNSHSSVDPFLVLIFLDVFEKFLYIFHFSCIFLIWLGCVIWLETTISLYCTSSLIELVTRSRI